MRFGGSPGATTYNTCLRNLNSFLMVLNLPGAGQNTGERNVEQKAGCLRCECTGGEEKKASDNTVVDGQWCVEKRDEAEGAKVQGWVTALGSLS